jgi:hypothetical protein
MRIHAALWSLLAVTLAAGPQAIAMGQDGIPLPSGHFSFTDEGSGAICVNPASGAPESCTASGVAAVPLNIREAGALTREEGGNACVTITSVLSALPVGASPPSVVVEHVVLKVTDYDSTTGTGDEAGTDYIGGACNGATFHSAGATQSGTGTLHFVVSDGGNRIDSIFTALGGASYGAFSVSTTELRQTRR